jgi:2-dehydro-3-deoxy-D-arabinonate dehydratase
MQLCKVQTKTGEVRTAVLAGGRVHLLGTGHSSTPLFLCDILHAENPSATASELLPTATDSEPSESFIFLPPIDHQEVWAAGVTYKRSREARERESVGAARFYDLVYSAARPELFFKATARRVVGPGSPIRIRHDSTWTVPEPELALVISPRMQMVGYTIGNDMSARDIEGENPLYLPQAKLYDESCSLGPAVTLAADMPPPDQVAIHLTIERNERNVFEGSTRLSEMARSFPDLLAWLGKDNSFPHGVILLTGTGIVPPDTFSLASGDTVSIDITSIGRLTNKVVQN